jgi:hypothetical protein
MAAPALPQPASTALFDDVSKDPFDGTYGPLLAPFDISLTDANPTPNNVCQQIAAASNQRSPLAIVLLVNRLLHVYCLPFRCDQVVGAPTVPALDGRFFAFNGKLILGQGVLVEIPAQWFNMTAQVQVPTVDNIRARLAADASPTLTLGPYAGGNPDTVAIKSREAMVLPHKYVGLFLAQPDGMPPHYYFDTILSLLEANGTSGACVALTKYCQMAITVTTGGESTLQVVQPTPPAQNVSLLTQSHLLLCHYFPTLGTQPPTNDIQPLVAHLTAYQNEQTACQNQARQEKIDKERTTVAVWLGLESFSRLLRYSQVASKDHLSPLWKALAGAPARDRLMILQGKVCGKLLSMDAVILAEEFTVDLNLVMHLTSLHWAMITPDSLETGCLRNAFLFTDSASNQQAAPVDPERGRYSVSRGCPIGPQDEVQSPWG